MTPIVVGDSLFYCTGMNRVFALDAETGAERWSFDPQQRLKKLQGPYPRTCRGVAHWKDPAAPAGAACAQRIFTGTLDAELIAIDAATGRVCEDFGAHGRVALRDDVGASEPSEYYVTSPPLAIRDVVVVGALITDNQRRDAASGVVRAFDARSGALRWSWDPVPPGWTPPAGLAERRPALHGGHRERLVDPVGRRGARPGLRADRQCRAGLFRREPPRPRLLLELHRRARRADRRRPLALPDRPPRRLGLRRAGAADARRAARRGPDRSRRRAGDEDGARVPARSRDRRAALPGRGAARARERRRGRDAVADAALPDPSAAAASGAARRPRTPGASRRGTAARARRRSRACAPRASSRRRACGERSSSRAPPAARTGAASRSIRTRT